MAQSLLLRAGIAANASFQARVYGSMVYTAWYKMSQATPDAGDIALGKTILNQTADMYAWAMAVVSQTQISQGTYSAPDGSDIQDDVVDTQVNNIWAVFVLAAG